MSYPQHQHPDPIPQVVVIRWRRPLVPLDAMFPPPDDRGLRDAAKQAFEAANGLALSPQPQEDTYRNFGSHARVHYQVLGRWMRFRATVT